MMTSTSVFFDAKKAIKAQDSLKQKGLPGSALGPRRIKHQRDSLGGPVVKILPFHCRGRRFDLLVRELRPCMR